MSDDTKRLLAERDARIAELKRERDEATAETKTLRKAADELLEACDTSDGCRYGTLSTSFIRQVLGERGTDRDALIAQLELERDEMNAALRDCLLLASRHRHEEWAQHVMRFCSRGGVVPSPLRGES